jgi:hypothetical protein
MLITALIMAERDVHYRDRWLHLDPARKEEYRRAASQEYKAWYRAKRQAASPPHTDKEDSPTG